MYPERRSARIRRVSGAQATPETRAAEFIVAAKASLIPSSVVTSRSIGYTKQQTAKVANPPSSSLSLSLSVFLYSSSDRDL